jgi:carboxymethylenebutenolidase
MRQDIIILYDDFTHGRLSRRTFMDRLVALVGSSLGASAVLAALTPDKARAAMIPPDDTRVTSETVSLPEGLRGYLARPADASGRLPAIVIVHENRGLNPPPRS